MKNNTSIKTIAKELNISNSTVSRALHNHPRIGLKTKETVFAMAKKLNYVPNQASSLLRNNKTYTIGLIIPYLKEEFFSQVISSIEDVLDEKNYHVQIFQSRDSLEREIRGVENFLKMRVDGVIVSVSAETNQYNHFKKLEEFGIPVIFFDRIPRNFPSNNVKSNILDGASQIMKFLFDKNRKNVGLLNGPSNLYVSDERLNGYLKGVMDYNFTSSPQLIKSCNLAQEQTIACIRKFFSQDIKPDSIITFNDYVALWAMDECKKLGIKPNEDVLFVSFANLSFTSFIDNPPLASVEQYPSKIGVSTAHFVLDLLENENISYKELVIETDLIIH